MTLVLTQGDTGPSLTGTVNANLTGATSVKVNILRPDGTTTTRTVTVVDPVAGKWSMAWQVGDLALAGDYYVETEVVFSSGEDQTYATGSGKVDKGVRFVVRKQIA